MDGAWIAGLVVASMLLAGAWITWLLAGRPRIEPYEDEHRYFKENDERDR